VYYSESNDKLYKYDPSKLTTSEDFTGDFTGDLKIDSINNFMFWTEPTRGSLIKYDMATDTKYAIIDGLHDWTESLMGLACDPSTGDLYYVSQLDEAIYVMDYSGTNKSTVHELSDYSLIPYGIDLSPAEIKATEEEEDDPGYMFITGCDDYHGYIYTADLFGEELTKVYETTTKDIYGIVLDDADSKMWWIENKGVANGLFNSDFDGGESNFIAYLEGAYWIAAAWDYDLVYVADYAEDIVYEMEISDGDVESTTTIATPSSPRCIAFWDGEEASSEPSYGGMQDGQNPNKLSAPEGFQPGGEPQETEEPDTEKIADSDTMSPESILPPTSGDETTDQMVEEAEAASETVEDEDAGSDPSYQPGGGLTVKTMAEKPDQDTGMVPPQDSSSSGGAPPTDVSSGMSAMSPGQADVEEGHIAGENSRTNDGGSSDTMPEGTKGAGKEEGWQSTNHVGATELEADEPASSSFSIDPTFFTIGGLLVLVGLAAFVVYSRQTRGVRYHPVHEAI